MYSGHCDNPSTVGGYGRGRILQKLPSDSSSKPSPTSDFAQTRPANPNTFYDARNCSAFSSNDTSSFMCGRGKGRGREPDRFVSSPASGYYNNSNHDDNWSRNGWSSSSSNKGRGKNWDSGFTSRSNLDTNSNFSPNAVPSRFAEKEEWDGVNADKKNLSGFGCGFACASDDEPVPEPKKEKSLGGFMDWETVLRESEEAEKAKWAGLPPIIKNFYVEHSHITAISEDKIDEFRLSKNNIMVQDLKSQRIPPKPIMKFEHAFRDQPEILAEIAKQGFVEPSPIQCQMWPTVLSGFDVIGIAQTGTGKTLSFLLPIFLHLDNQPIPSSQRRGPGCLILSPTRELALQIHSEVKKYRYKKMRSVCLYGGGDRQKQVESVLEGVDIVIATPGRLNDLVCDNYVNLKTITFVVLDEADRMLDMGFEPQIKIVLNSVRPDRQTVMTSATWPPGVRRMAESYTKDAFLVVIGSLDLTACNTVTQVVEVIRDEEKRARLVEFLVSLKEEEKIIVFVGKKSLVDDLASDLSRMGISCQSLHGNRDQSDREQALSDIKSGRVKILIATDVASRGLDIVDITHVFNYDFPRHMEEYVHRVGRTGRAGRSGVSITFVTRYDWRNAKALIKILEDAKQFCPSSPNLHQACICKNFDGCIDQFKAVPDDLRAMAERYEQKLRENPEMANRRTFYREKKPFHMEDYL